MASGSGMSIFCRDDFGGSGVSDRRSEFFGSGGRGGTISSFRLTKVSLTAAQEEDPETL